MVKGRALGKTSIGLWDKSKVWRVVFHMQLGT
jgi:hypothetical protein